MADFSNLVLLSIAVALNVSLTLGAAARKAPVAGNSSQNVTEHEKSVPVLVLCITPKYSDEDSTGGETFAPSASSESETAL
jgi:hypothetical protein